MFTALRVTAVVATISFVSVACGGASLPASATVGLVASPSATPTASGAASTIPSPGPPSAAALPSGYLLLEHFGNAADGTKVAEPDRRHLWLVKADGTDLHELAPGLPVQDKVVLDKGSADWSPDSRHIVFSSSTDRVLIYETDLDGAVPRLISTDCAGTPDTCLEFFPSYSPDGKRIAFIRLVEKPPSGVLGVRDLASGKVTLLESTRQGPPNLELGSPSWSPDGKHLVYFQLPKDSEGKPTGGSQLFIVNADGSGRRPLSTPGLAVGDPRWSPDGSLIVFSTEPIHQWNDVGEADHPDLFTIHPDGTGVKRLTFDASSGAPSWTSDGRILYYDDAALWLMDADGSNQARVGPGSMDLVSDTTGYSYYARWQPTP